MNSKKINKNKHLILAPSNIYDIINLQSDIKDNVDTYVSQSQIVNCCISYLLSKDIDEIYKVLSKYNCI